MKVIVDLFIAFFRVGIFSIGGGYTLIPLIEREVVSNYKWLGKEEFVNILGISQGLPGAISMKFATYVGFKEAGILGAITANIGIMLPPILGTMVVYYVSRGILVNLGLNSFLKGVTFGTIGLLLAFTLEMSKTVKWNLNGLVILLISFLCLHYKIYPGFIILLAGIVGLITL